ncbi:MAG: hypothetical protein V4580_14645 [Bacteroidota bacterium]
MKSLKYICYILISVIIISCVSSCRTHRDCKGRKKTAKTAMGGWL